MALNPDNIQASFQLSALTAGSTRPHKTSSALVASNDTALSSAPSQYIEQQLFDYYADHPYGYDQHMLFDLQYQAHQLIWDVPVLVYIQKYKIQKYIFTNLLKTSSILLYY